jgi:transposase
MSPDSELLPGLEAVATAPRPDLPEAAAKPRVKAIDRSQTLFQLIDVEQLIEPEHPARAIWDLVGRLDLSRFYQSIQAVEGGAGREPWDPRLLISLWVYAYSRGISSARELSRHCDYEPAFQWLAALGHINYHTLSDFRSAYDSELPELFTQVLAVLSSEGLVSLERVMHDGTKIKALASKNTFERQDRLQEHLRAARQQVEVLKDWTGDESARQKAARERAVRERQRRVEQALKELATIEQSSSRRQKQAAVRVSHTDPQARVMKQSDGGYAPSYNVQLSTDAAHKVIVGAGVIQSGNDWGSLVPAMQLVEDNCGAKPKQVVVDAGFTTRSNVVELSAQGVEMIGSLRDLNTGDQLERRGIRPEFYPETFEYEGQLDIYRCPMGTVLTHIGRKQRRGAVEHTYRAHRQACQACPFQRACCGREEGNPRLLLRIEEPRAMEDFCQRMQQPGAKAIYRQRAGVAEFPNAWIKEKLHLRQFRLRGLVKVGLEVLWACLTYNIQVWIRVIGQQQTMKGAVG